MADGLIANERAPMERPVYNATYVANTAAVLRAQALHQESAELSDPRILDRLHEAQDDVAAAIQLIEEETGAKQ